MISHKSTGLLGFSWWLLSCLWVFLMHLQAVGTGPLVLLHETSVSMWPLALCMPPRCFSLYPRLLMSALGLQVEELEWARLSWCPGSQVSGLHFLCILEVEAVTGPDQIQERSTSSISWREGRDVWAILYMLNPPAPGPVPSSFLVMGKCLSHSSGWPIAHRMAGGSATPECEGPQNS